MTQTRRRLRRAVAKLCAITPKGRESAKGGLRVLTYHRVNDSHPGDRLTVPSRAFEEQMRQLAAGYRCLTLSEAFDALRAGENVGEIVAVTFDDGYRDNAEIAFPVLERHRVRATFFLVSGNLGSSKSIERYASCCSDDASMTVEQARELLARGHEIGAHGRTHRELATLGSEDAREEIAGSRDDLTRALGTAPRAFCYPRGAENADVRRWVESAGFGLAVTVYPGANHVGTDPFALRRTEISGDDELADFGLKLEGGFDRFHHLVQRVKQVRTA